MMLCDVIGDLYGRSPYYELAVEESAVERQKALIDEIHRRGGYVLMSSHTLKDVSTEESVMIAKAHIERGADIIKIVNKAASAASIPNHIAAIQKITAMTDKKLLLLVSGEGQIVRYIGANFGVCMYLCVAYHNELDTKEQPTLAKLKAIRENLPF
jgi:3-dehydroquinate dehydratase